MSKQPVKSDIVSFSGVGTFLGIDVVRTAHRISDYEGDWKDGKFNGFGRIINHLYPLGISYEGMFVDGKSLCSCG